MMGLTVRWSLAAATDGVEDTLAAYIAETSHARFTGMSGLRFKTWRQVPGEWFEGCYVFATTEACDVVAVAEGWEGFASSPRA